MYTRRLSTKAFYLLKMRRSMLANGQVITGGTIKVNNGKIEAVGTNIAIPADMYKCLM